ncbi:sugar transporter [Photobacterium angustum]|uniref:Sugar transporter n=2 Tax=Photobacterium angustum TaxID=661 RepID=A0ABX5GXX8_PHOAN|nr:sugar transporter [Photobacterium angustum]KJG35110.1 sugar transporter [Photobacterium angustum]PSX01470.1 sugar transporter [Photobacterium angustum]
MRHLFITRLYPLLYGLWLHRYLLVLPIIIMPFLMTIGGFLKTKYYYSETTILVQEAALLNPFLEDLSISMNLQQRIKALQVVIQSQSTLAIVIDELDLVPDKDPQKIKDVTAQLEKGITLDLTGNDLVQMSLVWQQPKQIPEILNTLSRIFLEKLRAPGRASVDNSEVFLQKQLTTTQKDLELAESELATFKAENADNLPLLQGVNVDTSTKLVRKINESELALLHAKSKRDSMYKTLINTNPVIGKLEQEIVIAEAELAILRASYTDKHSSIKNVLRRLNRLKQERTRQVELQQSLTPDQIDSLWQRLANSSQDPEKQSQPILLSQFEALQQAESEIDAINQELVLLKKQAANIIGKRVEFAELEKKLTSLERNYKVKSTIYNQLLERYEMARVTGHLGRFEEPDKLKIIDKPSVPNAPQNWPWWVNFLSGILFGAVIALFLVGITIIFDTRLYQSNHIRQLVSYPILVRIPYFSKELEHG